MALSTATITFDISDALGGDYDSRRIKGYVTTNIDGDTVIDTVGNAIRLGSAAVTIASDGTGSVTVWVPGTGSNPDTWQTYLHFDYPDTMTRTRKTRTFGPFTITTSGDLADLVEEQEVPPTYITTVTTLLDGYVTEAEGYADAAAASAADAVDISGISTSDGVVSGMLLGTAGAGPLTRAALVSRVQTPRGEDAKSLGIPTDGVSDCSAAFAAIPAGTGRVTLRGTFICNSGFTLNDGVWLDGGGWHCSGQPSFGAGTFNTYITGTQIRFTNTTGTGILMAALKAAKISNLAILGPGSGTSRGVQVGQATGLGRARIDNVLIGNFYEGLYCSGMMNSAVSGLYAVGCGTGVKMRNASNGNAFLGTNVETCSSAALDMEQSQENAFTGGVMQGNTGAATVLIANAAAGNVFTAIYFENSAATYAVDTVSGTGADYNQFTGCHFGTTGDKVRFGSNHNTLYGPQAQQAVTLTGTGNFLMGCFTAGITESTSGNVIIDTSGNNVKFGARDITITTGKKVILDAGGGNYINRDTNTGDTQIGSPTGIIKRAGATPAPLVASYYVAKTANYTITDYDYLVNVDVMVAGRTITLPTAVGRTGQQFVVRKSDAGANVVTIATTSSQTINGASTYSLTAQYQIVRVVSDGANWMVL